MKMRLKPNYIVFVINTILVLAGGIGVFLFHKVGSPYMRGFYCDDESISKPFIHSTVPSATLVLIAFILLAITIITVELTKYKQMNTRYEKYSLSNHPVVLRSLWMVACFLYGCGITQFVVDCGKYTLGRLRPHFLSLCNPDFSKLNCTVRGIPQYITEDVCTWRYNGEAVTDYFIRDSRLSCPSGHASMAMFTAVYLILYIELDFTFGGAFNRIPKMFAESLLALGGFFTCLSRVSDYKHHPLDIIVGGLLGTLVATVIVFRVCSVRLVRPTANSQTNSDKLSIQRHPKFPTKDSDPELPHAEI